MKRTSFPFFSTKKQNKNNNNKKKPLTHKERRAKRGVQVIHFTVGEEGRAAERCKGERGRQEKIPIVLEATCETPLMVAGGEREGKAGEVATLSGCSILSLFSPQTSDACVCVCVCVDGDVWAGRWCTADS